MKITREDIVKMRDEIYKFCKKNDINKYEFTLFYNNRKEGNVSKNWRKCRLGKRYGVNPHDYCEYYSEHNIMAIACDGQMYELLNGYLGSGLYDKFESIFKKYNCYIECCDSCHFDVVYLGNDEDVEYTVWKRKEIKRIYGIEDAPDSNIMLIMENWMELSRNEGDVGSCVIGAYMQFDYKNQIYRMEPQSPYQGSLSWERSVDAIKAQLESIGAINVFYNCGRLD